MLKLIKSIFSKFDIHTKEVIKKSASSSLVKIGGMLVGLAISIFLGRTIGADGLGIINLSNRVVSLFIILGLLGMRQVLIKYIAIGYVKKNWQLIGDSMFTSYWVNGMFSIGLSILLIISSPWIANNIFNEPRLTIPLIIAFIAMVPQVFSRIFSSGLIGFRKIWQSSLVDQMLSITIVAIFLFLFWLFNYKITIVRVALFYGIGRIVVTISMWFYWKRIFPYKTKNRLIIKKLLKTSMPLFVVSVTLVVATNASSIMLGWLGNAKQVGLYSVAARLALLTSFFLQVSNAAVSPKIAALFAENKKKELGKMVQQVTKGLSFIAVISLVIFVLFGKLILLLWGSEFQEAYIILIILSIGQFFNISTGASGILLIMCGFEKIHSYISLVFVFINLFLNFILINKYGVIGAAIATSITVTSENITKVIMGKIKIGIITIPFLNNKI